MPTTTLDMKTLFKACRILEKYYGGAAELVGGLAWQPGVGMDAQVPGVSPELALAISTIADDGIITPPCHIFPRCEGTPERLLNRLEQIAPLMTAVLAGLRPLSPYFVPRPDLSGFPQS